MAQFIPYKLWRPLLLALVLLPFSLAAQDLNALRRQAEASQASVMTPTAPCNSRPETFAEFIVRFTVDADFNARRSDIAQVFAIKPIADYRALAVTQGYEAGYVQLWRIVNASEVRLCCGYEGMPADYCYLFRRDAQDQWRLVDRVAEE